MSKKNANRNTAKHDIERQYIAFFDSEINFSWNESDVARFRVMWENGLSILGIAKKFNRPPLEIVLLALDLGEQELIVRRPGGIYGI